MVIFYLTDSIIAYILYIIVKKFYKIFKKLKGGRGMQLRDILQREKIEVNDWVKFREVLNRFLQCPHPVSRSLDSFTEEEKRQGGRNQICPQCKGILWVPLNPKEKVVCLSLRKMIEVLLYTLCY